MGKYYLTRKEIEKLTEEERDQLREELEGYIRKFKKTMGEMRWVDAKIALERGTFPEEAKVWPDTKIQELEAREQTKQRKWPDLTNVLVGVYIWTDYFKGFMGTGVTTAKMVGWLPNHDISKRTMRHRLEALERKGLLAHRRRRWYLTTLGFIVACLLDIEHQTEPCFEVL